MRTIALFLLLTASAAAQTTDHTFSETSAERFARLALACVHKEYPNHVSHTMNSDADVRPPRELTPSFYGCYDWHSSVHGHWLLARLIRIFPDAPYANEARAALKQSLTAEHLQQEAKYLSAEGRASFERPYGLAWLLQLATELHEWDDPDARLMSTNLEPLVATARSRLMTWLPKLSHPVRIGEHDQTAFGMGLMLDYARARHDKEFEDLLVARAKQFFGDDRACPIAYEPSGEDFLSPCLAEADVMRRVLPPREFARWLATFLPHIDIKPQVVTDPSDPKLAHLDGLNLSRAWMLNGIISGLPKQDARLAKLRAMAEAHSRAGLAHVTGEHYEGGHWLGSFAVYLATNRGTTHR